MGAIRVTKAQFARLKLPASSAGPFAGVVPYPPSVNHYWRHVVVGRRVRVLVSARGRAYREAVAAAVGLVRPLSGPLAVALEVCPPDRRRRDIDNVLKSLLDSLGAAGVFDDDSQVRELSARFGACVGGGEVRVTVSPLARTAPPPPSSASGSRAEPGR